MNEMIERVARALARQVLIQTLESGAVAEVGTAMQAALAACGAEDDLWPEYIDAARAAIEAMREPTVAMVAAGKRWVDLATSYRAMIDAALSTSGANKSEPTAT